MIDLSRRRFLIATSAGAGAVAAAGVLAAAPHIEQALGAVGREGLPQNQTIVLQVRDARTSEVSLMWSTREIVFRDPGLVQSLANKLQGVR